MSNQNWTLHAQLTKRRIQKLRLNFNGSGAVVIRPIALPVPGAIERKSAKT
jgi:hypothetical protein